MQIALRHDVAQQDPVVELIDPLVGRLPLAAFLEREDFPVKPRVFRSENRRKG